MPASQRWAKIQLLPVWLQPNGTIIYKMNIILYSLNFETSDWDLNIISKIIIEVTKQKSQW